MKDNMKIVLITTGIGAAAGVLMAAVLLYIMISSSFVISGAKLILCGIAAFCLPLCAEVIRSRGIPVFLLQAVMVLVSLMICMLYGCTVSSSTYASSGNTLLQLPVILHGIAAIAVPADALAHHLRKKD